MIRVHVICEGQTEEVFVNRLLAEAFQPEGIYLYPSLIGKPGHKGGNFRIERLYTDIRARLLGDSEAYCTTFFDFYGLPPDFPGKQEAAKKPNAEEKYRCLTTSLLGWLTERLGGDRLRKFIPYVQMHEFEGLLFSNPDALAEKLYRPELAKKFADIRRMFDTPEDINDSPETAPSKRIKKFCPNYEKPLFGSLTAMATGPGKIREECPLFNAWLERLEALKSENL